MFSWACFGVGLLFVTLPEPSRSDLVELDPFDLSALRNVINYTLDFWVKASFNETNDGLTLELGHYRPCEEKINATAEECGQCVADSCLENFEQRCQNVVGSGQPEPEPEYEPQVDKDQLKCLISPESCIAIEIAEKAVAVLTKAVETVKDVIKQGKKILDGISKPIKKIFGTIGRIRLPRIRLPRIRVPTIRLPRTRLPRIRLPRLPRIRLPRIPLPRIRLPRIRLPRIIIPRIRLPRIRLPRIRLPRIPLPRFRLPRIRIRLWGKRKRQANQPSCDDILNNPDSSCLFYQPSCDSCNVYGPPGNPQTQEQLITAVCGPDFVDTSRMVGILENRLQRILEVWAISNASVFNITSVKYDPTKYDAEDGHTGIQVSFLLLNQEYNVTIPDPVLLLSPEDGGGVIAEKIFYKIFEDV